VLGVGFATPRDVDGDETVGGLSPQSHVFYDMRE
jgi:hypothetical protein